MRQDIYFGWALIIPAALAMIYGTTSIQAVCALGYELKPTFSQWLKNTLPILILYVLWCVVPFPLILFYVLVLISRLAGRVKPEKGRLREWFLINLVYVFSIADHMILIGAASMACRVPMNELLQQPFWRIVTLSIAVVCNILVDEFILRRGLPLTVLRTQADSEEVRPFITFLWFCNVFLLLDGILCSLSIEWKLLPLFLLCSTLLLEFYLYRFLKHIYSILKVHYLEDEHQRLMEELEQQELIERELRRREERDAMTGIYSRRYVLEKTEELLREKRRFSLVYLDLDKLKMVNDQDGHEAGDSYLVRFVRLLEGGLRKSDVFGRIGGDEFVILLLGCSKEDAENRMERVRDEIAKEICCGHAFSFSFGVSEVPEDLNTDTNRLLKQADQAMYLDKNRKEH